ncbi:long-chain fatty acid--CoA ligase [bacterium]|nr:long-chain fatty acid--CoA ligase [bacterium]
MTDTILPERSLAAIFYNRRNDNPDRALIIAKRKDGRLTDGFHTITRAQFRDEAERVAAGLVSLGIEKGDHIAVFSPNRPRWLTAATGVFEAGGVIVPVYPTLTAKEAGYVINHSEAKVLFVGEKDHLDKWFAMKPSCKLVKQVVVLDPIEPAKDGSYLTWDELAGRGRRELEKLTEKTLGDRIASIEEEDLAAIIYTSGTTGVPKGVMLSNGNFLSQKPARQYFDLNEKDIWLSHLPLCHSFGFVADYFGCFEVGGTLGMAEGLDPDTMREALIAVRPTVLMSVPRLYEKLYLRVHSILKSRPQAVQDLFWKAHGVGLEVFSYRNEGKRVPLTLAAKYKAAGVVLEKVKQQAGLDRLRVAYGGGGPLAKELMAFFNGLGIDIYQGYGLTETSPAATITRPGDNKLGTVGPPIEGCEVTIAEDGEILIRGFNIMKGYYKDPDGTAEAISEDGWFHSGDIGKFDEHGRLVITDRKKELIITSAGKNIAPMPIEMAFNTDPFIERVILIGDNRNYLTALVAPNFDMLRRFAKDEGIDASSDADLVRHPKVIARYQQAVDKVNADLARFEQIKKFTVVDHEFDEASGILTPTQKVKRRVVPEKYKKEIEAMYAGSAS